MLVGGGLNTTLTRIAPMQWPITLRDTDEGWKGGRMTERTALLESALDSLPDGIALLDMEGRVVYWNPAAEAITGYAMAELMGRAVPELLKPLAPDESRLGDGPAALSLQVLVHARHKLGHEVPAFTRSFFLRDGFGEPIGTASVFHPAERIDALPHGESAGDSEVELSQADFEDRLSTKFDEFQRGGPPFGVLWIRVDQGSELHKTHGAAACHAMLGKVQKALAAGLRPVEELGRWGEDEFLLIAHERTPQMLAERGRMLAGLARTADFRWWGDRISLTVSIGAAQADAEPRPEACQRDCASLAKLLELARAAMETSAAEGGNRVTCTRPVYCECAHTAREER